MAYCTHAQVADEFNGTSFSSTTNPTDTTVDRWIAEADVLIDAKVGLRYTVPIANATDLILMRQISIMLVAARVRRRLNRQGPSDEVSKVKTSDTDTKAMKILDDIVKGNTILSEASLINSANGVSSFQASCTDEIPEEELCCSSHEFQKGVDQW